MTRIGLILGCAMAMFMAPTASAFTVNYPLDGRVVLQALTDLHENTLFVDEEDVAFFNPDFADLNGNLVLDQHELDIFFSVVNPAGANFDASVQAIFEANADQVEDDFGGLVVGLAPETVILGAALATMGGPTDFETVLAVAAFAADFVASQPVAADYDLTSLGQPREDVADEEIPRGMPVRQPRARHLSVLIRSPARLSSAPSAAAGPRLAYRGFGDTTLELSTRAVQRPGVPGSGDRNRRLGGPESPLRGFGIAWDRRNRPPALASKGFRHGRRTA